MVEQYGSSFKMDFILLFTLTMNLSFTIKYVVNTEEKQDYFIFSGPSDATAHLFRKNSSVILFLQSNNNTEVYQVPNITNEFEFRWNEHQVNGQVMNKVTSKGRVSDLYFDSYAFLSPYLEVIPNTVIEKTEVTYHTPGINYGLILLIACCVGFIFKTDTFVTLLQQYMKKNWNAPVPITTDRYSCSEHDTL